MIGSAVLFSFFTNLLLLTGPLFMLQVYDRVIGSRSEETLVALFGLVVFLYLFYTILEFVRARVMARVGARLHANLSDRVFRASLERAALGRTDKGASALQDLDAVKTVFASPVLLSLLDIPWTPVFAAAIFIFHPLLGWLALAGGALLVVTSLLNHWLTQTRLTEAQGTSFAGNQIARQVEDGADYLWAQGMGETMRARWQDTQTEGQRKMLRAADWTGAFGAFSKGFRMLLQSAVLAVGAYLVLQHEMTAGAIIAGSVLLGRALAPVEQVLGQWTLLHRARNGWAALRAFLGSVPEPRKPTELPAPTGDLSVRGVSVSRKRGERPILYNVSFDVAPGEAIGVIGKSGSGKTTLARALVGLVSPTAGEVRLAAAKLDQYSPERLGQFIGYLPQVVKTFDGTIAENIAQMAQSPDAERVVAAAKKAHIHEIILQLPKGYDTHISARDAQLSGGQRQRLGLARALYNDPVLLVLDEPNSALDSEGSEALNAVVKAMTEEGKSVVLMTHRTNAIKACSRLVILESGQITAQGPRDEVIQSMIKNAQDVQRILTMRAEK
ncbi:type I secretion system permease/ATPase [Thioclava electrotropha]|uniref:type I secretion system permease/ATPase n=1 Tax=Thioclava electrotropha TaxID=1549850 RepID=UPI001E4534E1|nr:type I secretion system permease/ATPase [Thioclava electrotropha]